MQTETGVTKPDRTHWPFFSMVGIIFAMVAYAAWIEPNWLDVTIHEMPSSATGQRIRIVQLSDLHLQSYGAREKAISEKLQELKPDLIVLSGDVIDNPDAVQVLDRFLKTLGPAPKAAVLGNWEYWGDVDLSALRKTYEVQHGVRLLVNDVATYRIGGRTIRVVGLDDYTAGQPHLAGLYSGGEAGVSVLIQHSPGWFTRYASGVQGRFDLCLSGHTHGGQVTFFGLTVWTPRGSGDYSAGFYETAVCPLYVSKGLGTSVLPIRFGARPEIAVFDL